MTSLSFSHVAAAGTWDHFHAGHQKFLDQAFRLSEKVSVGIMADTTLEDKQLKDRIELFAVRKQSVESFLKKKGYLRRAKLVALNDIYGPALTDKSLEALVVTENTAYRAEEVSKKRQQHGLNPLQMIKVDLIYCQDRKVLSSSRIRAGEVNRQGTVYFLPFDKVTEFRLPTQVRARLKQPIGELIPGDGVETAEKIKKRFAAAEPLLVICVGDVVTKLFKTYQLEAQLYIVDLRVQRERKYQSLEDLGFDAGETQVLVENKPGVITAKLAWQIKGLLRRAGKETKLPVVLIKGEEDLAVIPAILAAPLESVVLYGQPKEGVVVVEVTESKKDEVYKLLLKFVGFKADTIVR